MSVDDISMTPVNLGWGPLAHSQQRLWLFQQLMPESIAYNTGGLLWLSGKELSKETIVDTFNSVVALHSAVHLEIEEKDGQPAQIARFQSPHITYIDAREYCEPKAFAYKDALKRVREPYNLVAAPLYRLALYQVSDDKFAVCIAAHHIIVDAWSLQLLVKAVIDNLSGKTLREPRGQSYQAFAAEQQLVDLSEDQKQWLNLALMSDEPCMLPVSNNVQKNAYQAGHVEDSLSKTESDAVAQVAKEHGITRFEVLSAAMLLTLGSYANHAQPAINVPALNRNSANRRNIGFYVNNAILGVQTSADMTLSDVLNQTKSNLRDALKFEHLPIEKLIGGMPLPTTAFNYRSHGHNLNIKTHCVEGVFEEFPVTETPFELVLDAITGDELAIRLVYAKERFTPEQIDNFLQSYKGILKQFCQSPERKLSQLKTLSSQDTLRLSQHGEVQQTWKPVTFMELVTEKAQQLPEKIALKHGEHTLTYAELEAQSNLVAHSLRQRKIAGESVVGVMMERGNDMLVAMLGIMKAGCVFLPLDPDYPAERISFMLEDSEAQQLLTQQHLMDKAQVLFIHSGGAQECIAIESLLAAEAPVTELGDCSYQDINLDQLAYLIYTSGSTGKPKGVAVSHCGLTMHVQTIGEQYGMTPEDTELHFASISFDGAVERWTVPLAFGSTLVIRDQQLWTPEKTTQVLVDERVTIACFPPSYAGPWLDWVEQTQPDLSLRSLTLGGEAFTRETFERIQRVVNPPRIVNGYGPTETVVTPMIWRAYPDDKLESSYAPIGQPVGDRKLYVLDENLKQVPFGSVGELYIGMESGLARGYLKRPDLTAERFIPDPFAANGERMYRTGDLVRFRQDGVVEYLGRADQQVKIRGFRIELGEIESRLQTLSNAEFCAVVAHESPTGKRLVGYVQLSETEQKSESQWRLELASQLPDYMVPSRIIVSQTLPLTPAGKVDRKQLAVPDWDEEQKAGAPLEGDIQHQLAVIWRELLKVESIGSDSHFFALGGDSITALQMVGKLRQQGLMLTPKQVFDHPVLGEMALCVLDSQIKPAEQGELNGKVALLPMQKRFVERGYSHKSKLDKNGQLELCNQYAKLSLPAPVNADAIVRALKQVVQHHDSLRLSFEAPNTTTSDAAEYLAEYVPSADFSFNLYAEQIDTDAVQSAINPPVGKQLSVGLNVETGEMLVAVHHLVIDALSWPVLLQDLLGSYQQEVGANSYAFASKTHNQADWYQALENLPISHKQSEFWIAQRAEPAFAEGSAKEGERNGILKHGYHITKELAEPLLASTQTFARMSKEQTLMALSALAVKEITSANEVVIHRESHGRFSESFGLDLSRSVNWHTSLFPQKVMLSDSISELLASVKDGSHAITDGGLSYSAGVVQQQWQYQDHVDVLFNFLGRAAQVDVKGAELGEFGLWRPEDAKADAAIVLNISETDDGFDVELEFSLSALPKDQCDVYVHHLEAAIKAMTEHCTSNQAVLTQADAPNTHLSLATLSHVSGNAHQLPNQILPLSTLQQGLYFHAQLSQETSTYVNQITLPIFGADARQLEEGWKVLMKRHSILRSTLHQVEGQAHLYVWDDLRITSRVFDGREEAGFELESYKRSLIEQGFELEQDASGQQLKPLWRVDLVTTGDNEIACIFTIHHILMDGWSTGVLLSELFAHYQNMSLPVVSHDFADYLEWVVQQEPESAQEYWREYLNGVEAPTMLVEQYGSHTDKLGHVRHNVDFSAEVLSSWQSQLKSSGITLNTLIQGAWLLTLHRYTGQSQPVFGNTVAGRPTSLANSEAMVGLFINTLPVTSMVDWQAKTGEWLADIQEQASAQREFSHVSLSEVQALSSLGDAPLAGENLFDSLVVFENYPLDENLFSETGLKIGEPDSYEFTHYPLTLAVLPGESLRIVFAYDSAKFSRSDIDALSATTSHYLEQLVDKLTYNLSDIHVLDAEQQSRLSGHVKASEPWTYKPFTELLKEQVLAQPDREALVANPLRGAALSTSGSERLALSYQQLDDFSDGVAAELIARGIQRDQRVGVMFARGADMLVAMIGVLKAGAAFLPLDPSYPQDRLAYMVEDSDAQWLISDNSSQQLASEICQRDNIIAYSEIDLQQPLINRPELLEEQLAYVIYTSGSTGKPKGVCVSHSGLSMHVQTIGQRYGMTPQDIELHFASISFDGAVERWTVPLAFGSKLVIRDQQLWSAQETCEVLEREAVTIACFPPSYVGPLLEWIEIDQPTLAVRSWTLGGEAFTRETYFKLQQVLNPKRIINGYGPTETVVTPMIWQAYPETPLESAYAPIGTAVGARSLYVLDCDLRPVPSGVSGELYIGEEVGLARGYLDRPDLTAERFVPDPFANNGERMYRTGDLVRWREDGVMEYLGRADDQIKIRGFRVELGEIESRLQSISGSKLSAVTAFEGSAGKYLVGYVEGQADLISCDDILAQMVKVLPDYMVPSQLVVMDSMPLTPASKVDKKKLPQPDNHVQHKAYEAPEGEIEQLLAQEWQALFGLEKVSRNDDFFAMGGQSLLATQLVGRLQQKHQIRLLLQSVFDSPRLDVMATQCTSLKEPAVTIKAVPRMEYMPVSASQKRLWFVQQLMTESSAYHMPLGLKLKGEVNREWLEQSLRTVIGRHEALRTSFVQVDGELMQSIHSDDDLSQFVLAEYSADEFSRLEVQRLNWIGETFDLSSPSLLRAYLIKHSEQEFELLLIVHHIISDGISIQNLMRELSAVYSSYGHSGQFESNIETDALDYADYASWQQEWLNSDSAKESLSWWKAALAKDIEPLVLHSDVARDQLETTGQRHHFTLTKQQVNAIETLAAQSATTPFNVMLSLWHLLLHKYSGRDEIRVGIPVAGRTQPDTQQMQGCFINNLVIPSHLDAAMSYDNLLQETKRFTEQALTHQDVPFEVLVESLGVTGNLQHHPLYQTSFNFQRIERSILAEWGGVQAEAFDPGVVAAQLELSLDVQAYDDGEWSGFVNYAAPVFDQTFVEALLAHWLKLLEQVALNPNAMLSELKLVDSDELVQIEAFNATKKSWGGMLPPPVAVEAQAKRTPEAIALSMGQQSMTYAEFDCKVNQLAQWLRQQGVGEETRVGLGLPRSFELVIGLHAITRAGGAYVPLDPSYPAERLNYILESADVSILLTDSETLPQWPKNPQCQYVALNQAEILQQVNEQSTVAPVVNWQADQSLYVIFTSGSTGLPKGVVNTQSALHNRLAWMQNEYQLDASDCVLQKTPFSFDVSVWEFFWPLMYGARLAIAEPDHHRQPELLQSTIREQGVTTIHFVPSMLHAFESETDIGVCSSLRRIICSGEALPAELTEKVLAGAPDCQLHNLYGPTEAAIDVTYWQCELPVGKRIPIGHAISNTQLHILDDCWNPVPVGVPGELYLAGDGLAREYLSRPDLTADRFVPNPFVCEQDGNIGSRMYRTGDQVVRMPDGRLEYLGRLDHQVKIRGLRIELEEIENVLNQHDDVDESAVIAYEHQTGTQLVAYVVCGEWNSEKETAAKAHLNDHLPDYMVPAIYVALDEMPLSPNGKRDRKALPSPEWSQVEYRAPESELEIWFANTWQQVLGSAKVGLDDNFFALGGHSLLATRIVAQAQKELDLAISLKDFFAAGTLQALTDALQSQYQANNEQEQDELDAMAALMDELELL
ncbi:non-ribosomal peptide synthetase [Vibrio europaeus]|uniref:Non-ribosomal peptide synthetase n=1 Tax=Vibrio europaeus TaxID=300876 RepID=A0A178J7S3_9VIBR|nr:non-ribosomal peptide synthetase [Vibrio europaeus]MDC5705048.1 non-ribosomal peptide synthetase [Vibrio europaeus]MDC5710327.1 non-ribosomal peptide synthetase [Vibrio europaeus]MDC5715417.1 non-ribosomal peptide synthetase [Vibrio europaeus]MDC5724534.1 non-ribosomal peptide synthetase [Vibrio europaeus]MDC5728769.1 non-ribosomal peptide synthetase [Vibrio europaeus]